MLLLAAGGQLNQRNPFALLAGTSVPVPGSLLVGRLCHAAPEESAALLLLGSAVLQCVTTSRAVLRGSELEAVITERAANAPSHQIVQVQGGFRLSVCARGSSSPARLQQTSVALHH